MGEAYFGGLDLAKRVDHSALVVLEYKNDSLIQIGQKIWPHINYKTVADDVLAVQQRYRCTRICFDRSGVGDAAQELFSIEIPLEEVISSLPKKLEIINLVKSLFHNQKLLIKDKELYRQVLEQEQYKSDAGNILYRHPSSSHDDVFWALGYACYAARSHFMGLPTYTMRRIDRNIKRLSNPVDDSLEATFGKGWNIQSG